MEGRRINLYKRPCGDFECLYSLRIKFPVGHIALLCEKKDKVLCAEVKLTVAVILKAVQLCVMSVAPAEFHRNAAEKGRCNLLCCI